MIPSDETIVGCYDGPYGYHHVTYKQWKDRSPYHRTKVQIHSQYEDYFKVNYPPKYMILTEDDYLILKGYASRGGGYVFVRDLEKDNEGTRR